MARLKNVEVKEREKRASEEFLAGRTVEEVQTLLKAMGGRMNLARIYEIKRAVEALKTVNGVA